MNNTLATPSLSIAGFAGLSPVVPEVFVADTYARSFRTGGATFRVTAINPNRPKCPISSERIANGRGFKFAAEDVAMYLRKARKLIRAPATRAT